jgi:hypothetical protein
MASPSFFLTQPIVAATFQGALSSTFFAGPVPASVNGHTVTPSDLTLQVSAGVQAFTIPEPSSMAMAFLAMGIVPLATWQVRRRRARA